MARESSIVTFVKSRLLGGVEVVMRDAHPNPLWVIALVAYIACQVERQSNTTAAAAVQGTGTMRAPPSLVVTSPDDTLDYFVASLRDHSADRLSVRGLGVFLLRETWTGLNFLSASQTMSSINTCIGRSETTNVEKTFLKDLRELASLEMFATTTLRQLVPKGPRSLSAKDLLLRAQVLRTAVLAQLLRMKCAFIDDSTIQVDDGVAIAAWQNCTNGQYLCPWPDASVQLLAASVPQATAAADGEDLQWVASSTAPLEAQYSKLMLHAHITNSVLRTNTNRLQYQLVRSSYDQIAIAESSGRIPIEDACDAEFGELWREKVECLNLHNASQRKTLEEKYTALSLEEQRAFQEELAQARAMVEHLGAEKATLHDRLLQERHRVQHLNCQLARAHDAMRRLQEAQLRSDLGEQRALEVMALLDDRLQVVARGYQLLNACHQRTDACLRKGLGEKERECEALRQALCQQHGEMQELRNHHRQHNNHNSSMDAHEQVARDYAAKASAEVASLQKQLEEARRAVAVSLGHGGRAGLAPDGGGCSPPSVKLPADALCPTRAHPPDTRPDHPCATSPRLPAFVREAAMHNDSNPSDGAPRSANCSGSSAAPSASVTCVLHGLDELQRPIRMGHTCCVEHPSLAELERFACASFDLPALRIGHRDPPGTGPISFFRNDHELGAFLSARRSDGVRPMVECCQMDGGDSGGGGWLLRPSSGGAVGDGLLDPHHLPQRPLSCGAIRANRIGAGSAVRVPGNLFVHSARPSRMMYSFVSEKALDQSALAADFCKVSRGRPFATRADVLAYLDRTFETFGVPERHNSILNTMVGPRRDGAEASRLTFNEFCVAAIRASQF